MDHPAARITGLYDHHAGAFDRERGRSLFERGWLDRFLALIPARGHVLDIGCGMGEPIGRHMIHRGFAVTGIDSAPAMIALCRARFPAQEWIVADMRSLALGAKFAGLLAWNSFFHLAHDDQRAMFAIFAAHAAPGAALMFTSGPDHGIAMGEFQDKPLFHASLDPAEYRGLLDANGFDVEDQRTKDPDCGGHTVWLARHR